MMSVMKLKAYLQLTGKRSVDLARALGKHPVYINYIVNGAKPSALLAAEIERWSDGAVPRAELRPDIFA